MFSGLRSRCTIPAAWAAASPSATAAPISTALRGGSRSCARRSRSVWSVEELGDGVQDPVRCAEVEERRDAGVGEHRHRARLALEAGKGPPRMPAKPIGKHFHRDVAMQPRVAGPVDLPHASGAKRRQDFVRAESRAGGEPHRSSPILTLGGPCVMHIEMCKKSRFQGTKSIFGLDFLRIDTRILTTRQKTEVRMAKGKVLKFDAAGPACRSRRS